MRVTVFITLMSICLVSAGITAGDAPCRKRRTDRLAPPASQGIIGDIITKSLISLSDKSDAEDARTVYALAQQITHIREEFVVQLDNHARRVGIAKSAGLKQVLTDFLDEVVRRLTAYSQGKVPDKFIVHNFRTVIERLESEINIFMLMADKKLLEEVFGNVNGSDEPVQAWTKDIREYYHSGVFDAEMISLLMAMRNKLEDIKQQILDIAKGVVRSGRKTAGNQSKHPVPAPVVVPVPHSDGDRAL